MAYLGVDVGKTNIGIVLGDEDGFLMEPKYFNSSEYWSQKGLEKAIKKYIDSSESNIGSLDAIGMAVPGVVNRQDKIVEKDIMNSNMDFEKLEESLDVQISIANDGDVAVIGQKQKFGAQNIVNVIFGSGIGAGVIYNGKMLWGDSSGGPEPGFNYVGDKIWQAYGGNPITDRVNEWLEEEKRTTSLGSEIDKAEELFSKTEDEVAIEFIERIQKYTARGIANTVNAYSPDILTFTGSVATQNPEFIKEAFAKASNDFFNSKPSLEIAEPDENIPLRGAVALARKEIIEERNSDF